MTKIAINKNFGKQLYIYMSMLIFIFNLFITILTDKNIAIQIMSTLLYLSSDQTENQEFIRPKIHKTHILPKVGNMTLLPNPG